MGNQLNMKNKSETNVLPDPERRLSFLLCCCVILLILFFQSSTAWTAEKESDRKQTDSSGKQQAALTILCSSDLHGAMFGDTEDAASMLKMASVIRKVRQREAREGRDILLLDCGDLISGSFESSLNSPEMMAAFLNLMEYDAIVPGNHDVEPGMSAYLDFCSHFRGDALCANLIGPAGKEWKSKWKLIRKNNLRIALIGCTAPYLDQWIPPGKLEGWRSGSLIASLDRIMYKVLAEKPDLILLMLHFGEFVPERLMLSDSEEDIGNHESSLYAVSKRFPQIQLIFGGHSHIAEAGKRLYPLTWYVQAPAHADGIIKVELFRQKEKTWQIRSELLPVKQEKIDGICEKAFADQQEHTDREKQRILAVLSGRIQTAEFCDHAVKSMYPDTVLTLFPKTGRKWLKKEITLWDLHQMYPYENHLCFLSLSREQFLQLINDQAELKDEDYILTAAGEKLTAEMFQPDSRGRMKVALSSYSAAGGGGRYPALSRFIKDPACEFQESTRNIRELFREYLQQRFPGKNNAE